MKMEHTPPLELTASNATFRERIATQREFLKQLVKKTKTTKQPKDDPPKPSKEP